MDLRTTYGMWYSKLKQGIFLQTNKKEWDVTRLSILNNFYLKAKNGPKQKGALLMMTTFSSWPSSFFYLCEGWNNTGHSLKLSRPAFKGLFLRPFCFESLCVGCSCFWGFGLDLSWENIWLFLVINFYTHDGRKRRCKVILLRNEMKEWNYWILFLPNYLYKWHHVESIY